MRLATSASIGVLLAQPSFRDAAGIVQTTATDGSCEEH